MWSITHFMVMVLVLKSQLIIQENIQAKIQSGLSFFDIDVDIEKGDYIISPDRIELLIVENIWVYGLGPNGHKEVILTPESEYNKK